MSEHEPVIPDPPIKQANRTQAWILNGMIMVGITLVIAAVAGLLLTNRTPEAASGDGPIRVGMRIKEVVLQGLDGKSTTLADYSGRAVLINTWATWCPPCRAEMPDLNAFYLQHRAKGFVILAINAGETRSQAADYAATNDLQFPVFLDPEEKLMDQWGIHDYPTSILIGSDGVVKTVHVGMLTPDALDREILPFIE